jgi:hypothetical protein
MGRSITDLEALYNVAAIFARREYAHVLGFVEFKISRATRGEGFIM